MPISNNTTYLIYRIVCFATGEVYVGQTSDSNNRQQKHFSELKSGKHHNQHLQRAYDKYGRRSFYFEVIESSISASELDAREIYWIDYFKSYGSGFNMTRGGETGKSNRKSCVWNGIEYSSMSEAAHALGITRSGLGRRLKMGYKCDADMRGMGSAKRIPFTWEGIAYPSITAAAKANGVSPDTMHSRKELGRSSEDEMNPIEPTPCYWNDIQYPSVGAAARACDIKATSMFKRLSKGYSCDADLFVRERPCCWNGIQYSSLTEAAQANHLSMTAMWNRLRRGYKYDADVPIKRKIKRE